MTDIDIIIAEHAAMTRQRRAGTASMARADQEQARRATEHVCPLCGGVMTRRNYRSVHAWDCGDCDFRRVVSHT